MKVKMSFPDIELSIQIEGPNIIDLLEFEMKLLLKMRKMVEETVEESRSAQIEKGDQLPQSLTA